MEAFLSVLRPIIEAVFPSPEKRLELEKAAQEAARQEAERQIREREQMTAEFIKILETTQPAADRVYVWANTLIALVRPSISVAIVLAMIFKTKTVTELVNTFATAGPSGWILLAPVLWWFFGRDIAKFLGRDGLVAMAAAVQSNGNGRTPSTDRLKALNEERQKATIEGLRRAGRLE